MQAVIQNNIISVALKPGDQPLKVPLLVRVINAVPWLQGITARFVGLGVAPRARAFAGRRQPSQAARQPCLMARGYLKTAIQKPKIRHRRELRCR